MENQTLQPLSILNRSSDPDVLNTNSDKHIRSHNTPQFDMEKNVSGSTHKTSDIIKEDQKDEDEEEYEKLDQDSKQEMLLKLQSSKQILSKDQAQASAHQISKDLAFTTLIPGHISGKKMQRIMVNRMKNEPIKLTSGTKPLPRLNEPIYDFNGRNKNPLKKPKYSFTPNDTPVNNPNARNDGAQTIRNSIQSRHMSIDESSKNQQVQSTALPAYYNSQISERKKPNQLPEISESIKFKHVSKADFYKTAQSFRSAGSNFRFKSVQKPRKENQDGLSFAALQNLKADRLQLTAFHKKQPNNRSQHQKGLFISENNFPINNSSAVTSKRGLSTGRNDLQKGNFSHIVNHRDSSFSNQYSNVWLMPSEMMYQDTSLESYRVYEKRQIRNQEVTRQKQQTILQRTHDNMAKEEICRHYQLKHGVRPNQQQRFFLSPQRLRDLLVEKTIQKKNNAAATKIQRWFTGRLKRIAFLKMLRSVIKSVVKIQRSYKNFLYNVIRPKRLSELQEVKAQFIQRCLKGYQVRRVYLREKAEQQADEIYQYWHRINVIYLGHAQRVIRREWKAYSFKKAEKKRKAAEAAAKKKPKRFGYKPPPKAPSGLSRQGTIKDSKVDLAQTQKPAKVSSPLKGLKNEHSATLSKPSSGMGEVLKMGKTMSAAPGINAPILVSQNSINAQSDFNFEQTGMFESEEQINRDLIESQEVLPQISENVTELEVGSVKESEQATDAKDALLVISESQMEIQGEQQEEGEGDEHE